MRRLVPSLTAAVALVLPASASAIVNGDEAGLGEYPAQAFIGVNTDITPQIDYFCGGTLIGSRQVLTAARCATSGLGIPRPASSFSVRLGDVDAIAATDVYGVADSEVHGSYVRDTGVNDLAILTLDRPADYDPVRVVDAAETAAWAPGTLGRVLGWGEISEGGNTSEEQLLTGDVAVRADADCPQADFDATVMLCAAGTPAAGDENPCASDTGSPLLVPDGPLFALAGVFSGASCATADAPGIFARVGDDPLNSWVHARTPEADFDLSHQPRANEPVQLFSTSRHPEGDDYFTTFRWDLDNDGRFNDDSGATITHTYTQVGVAVAGLEASKPGGDKAIVYYAFDVEPDPNAPPPATPTSPPTTPTPPPSTGTVSGPLATVLVSGRPKVRRGRFAIRIRFARAAPRGTAVIEVYRGRRRIGIARTKVRRGATKRVRVKLTPTGRRILARAKGGRLKVRVRVRVGRQVLRTKRVTIRR
jgi:hypothetical protein